MCLGISSLLTQCCTVLWLRRGRNHWRRWGQLCAWDLLIGNRIPRLAWLLFSNNLCFFLLTKCEASVRKRVWVCASSSASRKDHLPMSEHLYGRQSSGGSSPSYPQHSANSRQHLRAVAKYREPQLAAVLMVHGIEFSACCEIFLFFQCHMSIQGGLISLQFKNYFRI